MPMKNPVHPGRIVRHDCLGPLRLSRILTVPSPISGMKAPLRLYQH